MSKHKVTLLEAYEGKQAGETIEVDITQFPYLKGMGIIAADTKVPVSAKQTASDENKISGNWKTAIKSEPAAPIKSKPSKANP